MNDIVKSIFKEKRFYYYLIGAAVIALYAKTTFFDFTYLDDHNLVLINRYFLKNLGNILNAFKHDAFLRESGYYYRPMLTISLMLDAQLSGISPVIYHITNLMAHLTASCLLFRFFVKSGYSEGKSLFIALIFSVHPVLTQAVAWIPGRNDSLLTIFALLSFIFLINYNSSQKPKDYLLHLLFFVLALFTKESAVFLILAFILYDKLILNKPFYSTANKFLGAGWFVMLAAWFMTRGAFLKTASEISAVKTIKFTFAGLPALIQYVGKIIFPFNLSVLPIIRDTTFVYGIAAVVLISLALALSKNKRPNRVIFGILWFLIFMLPSFCIPNNYYHEHRLYLPMIGFIIMVCEIDLSFLKWAGSLSGVLVVLLFSFITFLHSDNYKNRYVYWENAAKMSPHSSLAHQGVGLNYLYDGKLNESERELKESIRLDEHNISSRILLGMVYWSKKMFGQSENEFISAIKMEPGQDRGYASYAGFCYSMKRVKEAEFYWKKAVELNPENIDVYKNLAVLYFNDNRPDEAGLYRGLLREKWGINFVPNKESGNFNLLDIDAGK